MLWRSRFRSLALGLGLALVAGGTATANGSAKQTAAHRSSMPHSRGILTAQELPGMPEWVVKNPTLVRDVQHKLSAQGFFTGPVNGRSSPALQDALVKFQQKNGIEPNGSLTAPTAHALGIDWSMVQRERMKDYNDEYGVPTPSQPRHSQTPQRPAEHPER